MIINSTFCIFNFSESIVNFERLNLVNFDENREYHVKMFSENVNEIVFLELENLIYLRFIENCSNNNAKIILSNN